MKMGLGKQLSKYEHKCPPPPSCSHWNIVCVASSLSVPAIKISPCISTELKRAPQADLCHSSSAILFLPVHWCSRQAHRTAEEWVELMRTPVCDGNVLVVLWKSVCNANMCVCLSPEPWHDRHTERQTIVQAVLAHQNPIQIKGRPPTSNNECAPPDKC